MTQSKESRHRGVTTVEGDFIGMVWVDDWESALIFPHVASSLAPGCMTEHIRHPCRSPFCGAHVCAECCLPLGDGYRHDHG
jgi:hypothetical protein